MQVIYQVSLPRAASFPTAKTSRSLELLPITHNIISTNSLSYLPIHQTSAAASVLTDLVFWVILVPMMAGKQFELTLVCYVLAMSNAINSLKNDC